MTSTSRPPPVARAVGQAYEEHEPSRLHCRPAPLALVLELREKLGERLSSRLEAPIPPGSMRVLWLAPSQRHVLDVAIDAQTLARTRDVVDDARVEDELGLDGELKAAAANRVRAFAGTWSDPMPAVPVRACYAPTTLSELIFLVEEAPEGGFTARALGAPIFTEADDIAALHAQIRDAVHCHFDEGQAPKIVRLHFVREELLAV